MPIDPKLIVSIAGDTGQPQPPRVHELVLGRERIDDDWDRVWMGTLTHSDVPQPNGSWIVVVRRMRHGGDMQQIVEQLDVYVLDGYPKSYDQLLDDDVKQRLRTLLKLPRHLTK